MSNSKSETESQVETKPSSVVLVEEEFKQEVAYKCGNEKEKSLDNEVGKEVDISEVIKHLVVEAQRKKAASRPQSKVFNSFNESINTTNKDDSNEGKIYDYKRTTEDSNKGNRFEDNKITKDSLENIRKPNIFINSDTCFPKVEDIHMEEATVNEKPEGKQISELYEIKTGSIKKIGTENNDTAGEPECNIATDKCMEENVSFSHFNEELTSEALPKPEVEKHLGAEQVFTEPDLASEGETLLLIENTAQDFKVNNEGVESKEMDTLIIAEESDKNNSNLFNEVGSSFCIENDKTEEFNEVNQSEINIDLIVSEVIDNVFNQQEDCS